MRKNTLLVLLIVSGLNVFLFAQDTSSFVTRIETQGMKKSLVITGYTGQEKRVNIPPYINGIPVRKIAPSAFKFKGLYGVIIPDGIDFIGEYAFYGNNMKSVYIPASVTVIGDSAFDSNILTIALSKNGRVSSEASEWRAAAVTSTPVHLLPSETRVYHVAPDKISGQLVIQHGKSYDPLTGPDVYYNPGVPAKPEQGRTYYVPAKPEEAKTYYVPAKPEGSRTYYIPAKPEESRTYYIPAKPGEGGTYYIPVKPEDGETYYVPINSAENYVENPGSTTNNAEGQIVSNSSIDAGTGTGIPKFAFRNRYLDKAVIPEGTTYIGEGAFSSNNLSSVTIPASVRLIGSQAFLGNNIGSITIGESVQVQPDSFRYRFSDYYRMNDYKAGTYVLKSGHWIYKGQ
jgi:hypothetical protein